MTFLDIALIVLGAYVIMIVGWVILRRIDTPDPEGQMIVHAASAFSNTR